LANADRSGPPATVAAEATAPDDVFSLVTQGVGCALVAQSHASTCATAGVRIVPVVDLAPAQLRLAWRGDDTGAALAAFLHRISRWHQDHSDSEPASAS
jgi:hypothetical protein